jgi:hypothetical protein
MIGSYCYLQASGLIESIRRREQAGGESWPVWSAHGRMAVLARGQVELWRFGVGMVLRHPSAC